MLIAGLQITSAASTTNLSAGCSTLLLPRAETATHHYSSTGTTDGPTSSATPLERQDAAVQPDVSMASDDESHPRSKRPTPMTRQSSSQSHISQSPSEGGQQRPTHHKAQRHRVVGQRVQRNTSFGKNLNKLSKAEKQAQQAQQAQQGAEQGGQHHRRSQSGNSVSAPSSPHSRPGFKRHASSGAIVRANQAQVQANLRKNHSSGHLPPRQGHGKHGPKSKGDHAVSRRALATPNRSRPSSPEPGAGVHFDLANEDEDGDEAGWTEESASQSPTTTRSNTRSNSVILDAQHRAAEINMERNRGEPSQHISAIREQPSQAGQAVVDGSSTRQINGGSSYQHPRLPDADMITSRLLQRSASHHVPPKTTSVAATVVSSSDRHNLLNHTAGSVGSTLVDTSGRDLVSRFMDGDGSAGTPHEGEYMAGRGAKDEDEGGGLDKMKRNKSMPNFSGGTETPSKTPQRSGTTTPTNLPPSRTQQKLMLQRASSNVEPQKLVPVTLPRTGGPTYLQSSIQYNANGEGRLDPRLLQQFNHVAVEYSVVRRYRNPIADAVARIAQMPGMAVKMRACKQQQQQQQQQKANGNGTGANSLSTSFNDGTAETDGAGSRRSRVSLEKGRSSRTEGEFEGRQSFESEQARSRNEAEEMCRRLWESAEVVEAD